MTHPSSRRLRRILSTGFCLVAVACGLQSPQYVDYREGAESSGATSTTGDASNGTTNTNSTGAGASNSSGANTGGGSSTPAAGGDACAAALTAFEAQVQPAIDSTCSSCHVSTMIAGKNLAKGSAAKNRDVLLAYDTTADGAKLIAKYSSSSHGGLDQSGALPPAKVRTWKEAEAACDE